MLFEVQAFFQQSSFIFIVKKEQESGEDALQRTLCLNRWATLQRPEFQGAEDRCEREGREFTFLTGCWLKVLVILMEQVCRHWHLLPRVRNLRRQHKGWVKSLTVLVAFSITTPVCNCVVVSCGLSTACTQKNIQA